ncbi:hypothetical protein VH88_13020 [Brevundimonas sp. KM4]|nr:hypothetical protein VH88_13020 [Brevundimonas sp. KM4]
MVVFVGFEFDPAQPIRVALCRLHEQLIGPADGLAEDRLAGFVCARDLLEVADDDRLAEAIGFDDQREGINLTQRSPRRDFKSDGLESLGESHELPGPLLEAAWRGQVYALDDRALKFFGGFTATGHRRASFNGFAKRLP